MPPGRSLRKALVHELSVVPPPIAVPWAGDTACPAAGYLYLGGTPYSIPLPRPVKDARLPNFGFLSSQIRPCARVALSEPSAG